MTLVATLTQMERLLLLLLATFPRKGRHCQCPVLLVAVTNKYIFYAACY